MLLRAVVLWVTGLGGAVAGWAPAGSGRVLGWSWNHLKAPLYIHDGALMRLAVGAGCQLRARLGLSQHVCTWVLHVAQAPHSQAAGIQQQTLQETGSGPCPSLKA